jgi:hypothetical protein
MYLFKGAFPGDRLFSGLWAAWTLDNEVPAAKVMLATVVGDTEVTGSLAPNGSVKLGNLPWRILQFQVVRQTDTLLDPMGRGSLWDGLHQVLASSFRDLEGPEDPARCQKQLFFNSQAQVHSTRSVNNRAWLEQCRIERRDNNNNPTTNPAAPQEQDTRMGEGGDESGGTRVSVAPIQTVNRAVVQYQLMRLPRDATPSVDVRVNVERPLPRNTTLGQMMHQESGYVRESNLLSAIEEWRTWITLGPFETD